LVKEKWQTSVPPLDRAFVFLALIFGNVLVFVNPPFQAADEAQHFFRAWQITQGEFVAREKTADGEYGGYLPTSLEGMWERFKPMAMHPEIGTSAKFVADAVRIRLGGDDRSLIAFGNTAHYCPLGYLPQCLGIGLGRIVSDRPAVSFYLGREGNLIAFIFLGYLALRWGPVIGRPVFLLLLMPTMLCLAASQSADVLSDGLAILFTAMVCGFLGERKIGWKEIGLLALVSIPLSVGKVVYVPLLALLILIPAINFGGRRRKAGVIAGLFAVNLLALLAWSMASSSLDTKISTEKNISPRGQLERIEQHPAHLATLAWNTAKDGGWFVVTTYVAVIGWMDLNFPPGMVLVYLLMLAIFCWTAGSRGELPGVIYAAAVILPTVAISCVGIAVLNLMYWTPMESNYILGLQGRYFIPLTPAIFLLAAAMGKRWRIEISEPKLNAGVVLFATMICACLVMFVARRFYF
jgi:uncharacterized membrane protein